jgi:hypothetical protein
MMRRVFLCENCLKTRVTVSVMRKDTPASINFPRLLQKIVRYVLSALFHISNRPGGVELLMRMIRHTNGEFYVDLIRHIGYVMPRGQVLFCPRLEKMFASI